MQLIPSERTLTELDHVRLLNLLRRDARGVGSTAALGTLEDVLDVAALVPSREIGADVVTMCSQVLLLDTKTRQRSTLTLCYPAEADPAMGLVSVLSPIGSALLGLRKGGVACWLTPAGEEMAAEVVDILFQPEASGDYAA